MAAASPVIDCDVHTPSPAFSELNPYLDDYYREGLRLRGFRRSNAVDFAYPAWASFFQAADDVTLDQLRQTVLGQSSAAILHCYCGLETYTHPYLTPILATAINKWLKEEWLDREPRLHGSAVISAEEPATAVQEIERIAEDDRFVQVLVPARSWEPYGRQRYWPIWEAAAAHGLPVCITYGGVTGAPATPVNWMNSFFEDYTTWTLPFASQVNSLIFSGIFTRCPDLRIVLSESGWSWLSPLLWRMDSQWRSFQRETPWLHDSPSEYARRHLRITTQPSDLPADPPQIRDIVDELGSDQMLMFGSDYPHRYPENGNELLEQLNESERQRVLYENARACYPRLRA